MRKARPEPNVLHFYRQLDPNRAFISVLTLGELRKGISQKAKVDEQAAKLLAQWVDHLEDFYSERTLAIDKQVGRLWGELSSGRTRPIVDTLLAATAIHHGLTLVTRNVRDVQDTPVTLLNPWLGS